MAIINYSGPLQPEEVRKSDQSRTAAPTAPGKLPSINFCYAQRTVATLEYGGLLLWAFLAFQVHTLQLSIFSTNKPEECGRGFYVMGVAA